MRALLIVLAVAAFAVAVPSAAAAGGAGACASGFGADYSFDSVGDLAVIRNLPFLGVVVGPSGGSLLRIHDAQASFREDCCALANESPDCFGRSAPALAAPL